MQDKSYVPFTKEMIKDYTVLVPNMLPMHFKLISSVLKTHGYTLKVLENSGPQIAETGLKYTHNDTCYPAILMIGQFMDALLSGEYDTRKTALIMFQTGGGCRASNYISLIRKALKKAGMEYVPVISLSFAGLEKHSGFKLDLKKMKQLVYAVLYGDLLMNLVNQVRPFETEKGSAERLADEWVRRLGEELGASKRISYKKVRGKYREIIKSFMEIPIENRKAVKVGIVGEIFVKYSPLGNNDLERFIINEGGQSVVPGLCDFAMYCVYDMIAEHEIYKNSHLKYRLTKFVYNYLNKKRTHISEALVESGRFDGLTPFDRVVHLADGLISTAVQMGEGWLLTAEMVELAESGCNNIVCTQPFGCLPNHICGKGMMKPIKELFPDVNIVAIDYDAGASRVNQENRLKLMLANAKKISARNSSVADAAEKEAQQKNDTAYCNAEK
ncbi:MAG: 2-hydroxyacyl-CoA dehydratase [Clostridia bacterium]|nr:2-hydroxyacyl-CoA dehydratase [Clostridia bacterium]